MSKQPGGYPKHQPSGYPQQQYYPSSQQYPPQQGYGPQQPPTSYGVGQSAGHRVPPPPYTATPYQPPPPPPYPTQQFQPGQQTVFMPMAHGSFDSGARFQPGAPPHIPPPPPGHLPTSAQAASSQGQSVVMTQNKASWVSGGSDGGYTWW